MEIQHPHQLARAEAKTRIDAYLERLIHQDFGRGLEVESAVKAWEGDRLQFRFCLRKGFLRGEFQGAIAVSDTDVLMTLILPAMLAMFMGEDVVRRRITGELTSALATAPP